MAGHMVLRGESYHLTGTLDSMTHPTLALTAVKATPASPPAASDAESTNAC